MKPKNILMDLFLCIIVTLAITGLIRPTITEKIHLSQEMNKKNTEQITTKTISLFAGNGDIIKSSQIKFPQVGDSYALLHNEERGLSKELYFGDTKDILDLSIGQLKESGIPGQNKSILLAGHNGTHFHALPNLEKGDQVQIDTSYGNYIYEVYETEIINDDDFDTSILEDKEELLIMYTCYPFDAIETKQRYFVYARKISGPIIDYVGSWSQ